MQQQIYSLIDELNMFLVHTKHLLFMFSSY
jgi:hypothetical protein